MQRGKLSLLSSLVGLSFVSPLAQAAAFQLYEVGTPIVGTASVGQSVVTDASAAYFNPAGMVFLPSSEFMLGSQLLLPYNNFRKNTSNTIIGDNGGNAGFLTPGMDLYVAYKISPSIDVGVSMTSPYGGSLNYEDGWVGRYVVQDVVFYTINVNPSIAYRINKQFSIGAGAVIEYMDLQETVALPYQPSVDGQVNIKVNNTSGGFNLAMMYEPTLSTKLGLAYRSQVVHNLKGDLTFLRIGATPNTTVKMIMPQSVIASISQKINCQLTLLGELGWSNWAAMKNTIVTVAGYTGVIPRDWNNTYRVGLAGQFQATHSLMLQAGASYDSSPTNAAHRLPDMPMDRQYRIGAGVLYNMTKATTLAFSYEYWNLGTANINNTSFNGTLSGNYSRNYANTVQVSVNVTM